MKRYLVTILVGVICFTLTQYRVLADDMDDLMDLDEGATQSESSTETNVELVASGDMSDLDGLGDDSSDNSESDDLTDIASNDDGAMDSEADDAEISISFGGYLKALAYWQRFNISDETWTQLEALKAAGLKSPDSQDSNYFTNVGSRVQLKAEGYLGDSAKLFTAINIDFNDSAENNSIDDTDESSRNASMRLVESFIEAYSGSSTWKLGPQLITWGYMEGFEVPTDRVNARDYSYQSTEYEDTKLPSNALRLIQSIGDSQLELIYIPVGKTDVQPSYMDYFYQGSGDPETPDKKPSNAKFAYRFQSALGDLDYAISYVSQTDPKPDVAFDSSGVAYRSYHRVRSPGLDLQFDFGSWLAKAAYVEYHTQDKDGDNPLIKNYWKQYLIGGEFFIFGQIANFYVGQTIVEDFEDDTAYKKQVNSLIGQEREVTNFISGHVSADFLTGNALNITVMAAKYWDEDGGTVQQLFKMTNTYKITNGLELLFSPSFYEIDDDRIYGFQSEAKYSF